MPKKIFTAPAPMLEDILEKADGLGFTVKLGNAVDDDGVLIWIEIEDEDGLDEAAGLIALAASAWDDYQS